MKQFHLRAPRSSLLLAVPFSDLQPAIEPFHRLSSTIDCTFLIVREMRSLLWIAMPGGPRTTIIMGTWCASISADRKTSLCARSLTHLAYKIIYLLIKIIVYIALAFCLSSSFIHTHWFQFGW